MIAAAALAANLGNVGGEYGKLKEPRRAIEYFDQALALHLELYPDGLHPDVAADYNNLGVQYLQLGDHARAGDAYDRALGLLLRLFPDGVHPSIALVYKNLASVWRARGDAAITKQARAMFDPVLEMKEGRAVMPDGPGWGVRIKADWLAAAERRLSPG